MCEFESGSATTLPGGIGISALSVYESVGPDGLAGGTPHVHLACSEGYYVIGGAGVVQALTPKGYSETPLQAGTVVWFDPGTIHRLVNDGGLQILALMSNSGLPEAGDAVMTLPPEHLTDRDTYLAATTLTDRETYPPATTLTNADPTATTPTDSDLAATTQAEVHPIAATLTDTEPTADAHAELVTRAATTLTDTGSAADAHAELVMRAATTRAEVDPAATELTQNATTRSAIARRDLALEGYAVLRERYDAEGPSALDDFYAAAVRIVRPQLAEWRERWEQGARRLADETGAALDALEAGTAPYLRRAELRRLSEPTEFGRHGMCGRLDVYDITS